MPYKQIGVARFQHFSICKAYMLLLNLKQKKIQKHSTVAFINLAPNISIFMDDSLEKGPGMTQSDKTPGDSPTVSFEEVALLFLSKMIDKFFILPTLNDMGNFPKLMVPKQLAIVEVCTEPIFLFNSLHRDG